MTREKEIYKVTLVGGAVNLLLLVFKFVAGILGHSSAMVADAVHSLSDFVTDIVVLVFVKISNLPKDKSHDYGHGHGALQLLSMVSSYGTPCFCGRRAIRQQRRHVKRKKGDAVPCR